MLCDFQHMRQNCLTQQSALRCFNHRFYCLLMFVCLLLKISLSIGLQYKHTHCRIIVELVLFYVVYKKSTNSWILCIACIFINAETGSQTIKISTQANTHCATTNKLKPEKKRKTIPFVSEKKFILFANSAWRRKQI